MKIIAIDDERPALELMMETLKRLCPDDEIISFNEVRALREYEEKSDIDVAFMDIELGNVTGIELAIELKKSAPRCNVIFVTSYSKYGTDSFKARPSGYVTKPYTDEEIKRELDNLRYPVDASDMAENRTSENPEGGQAN